MDPIDETMATADQSWRGYGVRRADRRALAADLRLDLESAAADGIDPAQLLGTDVRGFARRLADEAGVRRTPPEYDRVVRTALIGAALGAVLGYAVLRLAYPVFFDLAGEPRNMPVQVAIALYYGIPAAIVAVGAIAAVRVHLRDVPYVRPTAHAMSLLVPVAGVLITPVTMAFAWAAGYSTSGPVVVVETALVAGALAGATVLARRWSLREPAEEQPLAATPPV